MTKNEELRKEVLARRKRILDESRPSSVAYQHERGKLTARERISALCDNDSFLEFGGLAIPDNDNDASKPSYADALVTGWANINGRPILIASADFTVNGGSNGSVGLSKMRSCYERALNDGKPVIQLLEGVGHRISEGLDSRLFAEGVDTLGIQANMSGWVPSVAAILGQGFAAMTVVASLCDFVVLVRGISSMGIAPPPLVKAAIGETCDTESLGGADFQANRNGVADYIADNEAEAFELIRRYLSYFPSNSAEPPPIIDTRTPEPEFENKLVDIVPTDMRIPYDVRKVIRGIVDAESILEIKPGYAKNMVCCLARLGGRSIGIIANQPNYLAGSLDSAACEKASHFICLCDAFGIPLLSLIDLPGFLVGVEAERSKLARRSARLIYELSRISVPNYSIVLRKAYGAAYMGMNGGRSFGSDMALAWPTAEFAAMNVETAVDIAFKKQISQAKEPKNERENILADIRSRLGPLRAAEGFGIDDVILPEHTRHYLIHALAKAPTRKQHRLTTLRTRGIPPI
ncbi:acyl-CoA carboxylase subunit beta [Zhongshania marina]|uniref:Acyl-CoA carboxylase n=1 Tax=Zhongshania marina TaxID=2304603 RepID=A0ABX9W844_9GAMM|nr:acyl-CoA carboxylase [Zhongshania marina]